MRYQVGMRGFFIITSLLAATVGGAALAQAPIGTLPRGSYACELRGDAGGRAGQPQPQANITIESASRYQSPQGAGTYLRRGNTLVLTSGPRQGESYAIQSEGFLRRMENGQPGRLRCVHAGR